MQIQNLHFGYPQRALFSDWSARFAPGVTLVCGGEDKGKTTLLRLLAGELPAAGGVLQIDGVRLDEQPAAYRQKVFWIDPRTDAFNQLSVTAYFERVRAGFPGFDQQLLAHMLDGLALTPHLEKSLFMLSTGSKRKVWLAAAFAAGAAVTLLDSPFASLDKASIDFVLRLLRDAAAHRTRVLVIADYEAPGDLPLAAVIDLDAAEPAICK